MNSLLLIFVITYIVAIAIFLLMPRKGLDNLIKRDFDKDFYSAKMKDIGYYRIVILGAGITSAVITFLIKTLFY